MRNILILVLICSGSAYSQPPFEEFGNKFKSAVQSRDMKAIADMMQFPFNSFDWGYLVKKLNSQIETREDFMKVSKKIFDKSTLQTIKKEPFKLIENDDEKYYTIVFQRSEMSASWIYFSLVDGQWKATGTDNVSQ